MANLHTRPGRVWGTSIQGVSTEIAPIQELRRAGGALHVLPPQRQENGSSRHHNIHGGPERQSTADSRISVSFHASQANSPDSYCS